MPQTVDPFGDPREWRFPPCALQEQRKFWKVSSCHEISEGVEGVVEGEQAFLEFTRDVEIDGDVDEERLTELSPPVYGYFDPPWTPGFLRRNEVMLRTKGEK